MAKYDHQMRLILANIFHKKNKVYTKTPANWIRKMTNIVGGTMYQHAHADQAWPFELEGERTFPFVASHGFGVHPMQIWLFTEFCINCHPRLCCSCVEILCMPAELCGTRGAT